MSYCENCKWWKCMGFHYYECTNVRSQNQGRSMSRGQSCNQFEEE
jgi:hypothetical protein